MRSHNLIMAMKTRLLGCFVFSMLLYGTESWTLTQTTSKQLETYDMWLTSKMLGVSWLEVLKFSIEQKKTRKS